MQALGGYSLHQSLSSASAELRLSHFDSMKATGDINLELIQQARGGYGDLR